MVVSIFLSSLSPVFCQISITYLTISICFILMALCALAYYLKVLSRSGAIAAFFTALILGYGGLPCFYLPLLLLVGGSLLTKLNNQASDKSGRNAKQVLANGGIGLVCLLGYYYTYQSVFFLAYLVSFSVSVSDTFSSEIGKYFKGQTLDIIGLNRIEQGLSGGVTWQGTLGGLIGALLCSSISFYVLEIEVYFVFLIGAMGYAGMLIDSILGSRLQAKYQSENGLIVETPIEPTNRLIKGYKWCTNDTVNLLSNAITVIIFILLCLL